MDLPDTREVQDVGTRRPEFPRLLLDMPEICFGNWIELGSNNIKLIIFSGCLCCFLSLAILGETGKLSYFASQQFGTWLTRRQDTTWGMHGILFLALVGGGRIFLGQNQGHIVIWENSEIPGLGFAVDRLVPRPTLFYYGQAGDVSPTFCLQYVSQTLLRVKTFYGHYSIYAGDAIQSTETM